MSIKSYLLSLALLYTGLLSETLMAQAVKIGGEIRTRSELRDGAKTPVIDTTDAALVTNMRTRINLTYTTNVLKAKVTIQDTRTFGETAYNTAATGKTGIYEAWGEYLLSPGISFSIGRQPLEYDDRRMFSAANWSNAGNAHDVLLLKYNSAGLQINVGSAWNNASDVFIESSYKTTYKTLNFAWLTKSIGYLGASALYVNDGFQKHTSADLLRNLSYRNTVGGNIWYKNPDFPVTAYGTGYYQFGHDNSTSFKKLKAYLLAGKLQGRVNRLLTLTAGTDYYSGSKTTLAANESHTFNRLYGVNHFFNGTMEYWTSTPAQGLSDIYGGFEINPIAKLKADAIFHKFNYAEQPKAGNKNLGSELDMTVTYDLSPEIAIQGGYSTYFLTDAVKAAKKVTNVGNDKPQWAFLMISFKPTFLAAK